MHNGAGLPGTTLWRVKTKTKTMPWGQGGRVLLITAVDVQPTAAIQQQGNIAFMVVL